MALIEDEPPITRPRGQYTDWPAALSCGTVRKPQS